MLDPQLGVDHRQLAALELLEQRLQAWQIFRMHVGEPRLRRRRRQFGQRVAGELCPARVAAQLAGLHVPLGGAGAVGLDDMREPVAGLRFTLQRRVAPQRQHALLQRLGDDARQLKQHLALHVAEHPHRSGCRVHR